MTQYEAMQRYNNDLSFREGYDAYHLGESLDKNQKPAWLEGYEQAKEDEARED